MLLTIRVAALLEYLNSALVTHVSIISLKAYCQLFTSLQRNFQLIPLSILSGRFASFCTKQCIYEKVVLFSTTTCTDKNRMTILFKYLIALLKYFNCS